METISFDDFLNVDMRVGRVLEVEPLPKARKPAWKLRIDFGPEIGEKRSSAQITDLYQAKGLVGRQVVAVVNFPIKRIAGFKSEVLVLGVEDAAGRISLLAPDHEVAPGRRIC
jgi:tRNA-binding protein